MIYNVLNWYWVVGDQPNKVWSSRILDYIDYSDSGYTTWKLAGNFPTMIGFADDLSSVMQPALSARITSDGILIASQSYPALEGTYALDAAAQMSLMTLANNLTAGRPVPGGGSSFNYVDAAGQRHAFTKAQFLAFANGVSNYLYDFEQTFDAKLHGETANYPSNIITI